MTIDKIRKEMINYLYFNIGQEVNVYYDSDGYCGSLLFDEIKKFWKRFKTEQDLIYVVSGEYRDDIDLDGGRDRLIGPEIIPLLFDYLYNDMGYTLEEYNSIIQNPCGITDDIKDMYNSRQVVRDKKINTILE